MSGARRRARFTAMTLVIVLAATASLVIANVIGNRVSHRFDVTATREHVLSPRSVALMSKLKDQYEVVIAAPLRDPKAVDRRALIRLVDVLDQFKHAPNLSAPIITTLIDTGSAQGAADFESLIQRLRQRDQAKIDKQVADVGAAQQVSDELATWLEGAPPRLTAIRDLIPTDTPAGADSVAYFDRRAAECKVYAGTLRELAARSRDAMKAAEGRIPDLEQAAGILRQPLTGLELGLRDIADNVGKFALDPARPAAARDLAKVFAAEAKLQRDRCAVALDSLNRLAKLDITRIARLLQGSSAALLIGPPEVGMTATDLNALLPSTAAINASGNADLGRNAEELIATALAALAQPIKPIVVLMHAQPRGFFERNRIFETIGQRLNLRGIDLVVWEVAQNPDPPSTSRFNPTGKRPIVYVCFNADSPSMGSQGQTGEERAIKLGKALNTIVEAGEPLLLSIFPSTLPTRGIPDPTVSFLPKFGLQADSGHPLLHEVMRPTGREVQAFQVVRATDAAHPIANAIRGLPTRLQWPIPMQAVDAPRTKVTKLFEVNDAGTWGESQWLGFLSVPIEQHPNQTNAPSNDSPRDDGKGPWILAAAAERVLTESGKTQRLVVVGSNTWFTDVLLRDLIEVDGRPAAANPGNLELFEASVSWLAGQDDLIAQSPTARAMPLIGPLSGRTRLALRLLAIVGLPAGVLLVGLVWRLLRG